MNIGKQMIRRILFLGVFLTGLYALTVFLPEEERITSAFLKEPFETAYSESGAEMVSLSLRNWARLDKEFHDGADLAILYQDVRNVLGDDKNLSLEEYDDDGFTSIVIQGKAENGAELNLTLQSLKEGNDGSGTYLIAESRMSGGEMDLSLLDRYTASIFSAVHAEYNPSLVMEGKYGEVISKKEKRKIIKSVFAAVEGKIKEKVSDGNYLSCSGSSKNIAGGVKSGNHLINLQVVLSDNEEEGATYLYIGSPVVFSDF